ncbi:MOXD1 homolog 1 [Anopheles darlingi]|uniref:MOXD1 homolog 1 n=1 Tax=Anopheles darlingi TaxID=43151 RepID=UPI0021004BE5|nr:MOXD1 homolog 1 [Anopheles darlingi]
MKIMMHEARSPVGPISRFQRTLWWLLLVTALGSPRHSTTSATPTAPTKETIPPVHHRWSRSESMDPNGLYTLDWHVDQKDIVFTATANTRGFMGLGFSHRSEHMAGSDLVLVWVDDRTGKPNVLDCHGSKDNHHMPVQDDTQNYHIESGFQNLTHTSVTFRRALETCDPHDIIIGADTMKVLWSYGDRDPVAGSLKGHSKNRGARSIHFLGPQFRRPTDQREDLRQWDVTVKNVSIDASMDTLYWCKILKAPTLREKHHIIGYEALLTKESSTKQPLVHHMTLFECSTNSYPGSDPNSWDVWVKSSGAVCNSNLLTPRDWDSCITPVATWGVGASGQFLPEHIGIPIGGDKGAARYYMLEVHYDNPRAKRVLDHSGFRIHYTRHVRRHDAGMMISGVSVSDTQMIPPGQKLYRNVGICGPSCTGAVFPEIGINIVSAALHSHVAGRKMSLRHVREGKELPRIVEDDNYNHNFQQIRQLENETNVLPGDYLITDCAYETVGRRRPTLGGYSTKQEMCLSFITYYPKIELAGCYSMTPVKEFFETFGVFQFYAMNMTDVENLFLYNGNILDLLPTTIFPNFAPGGEVDDEQNQLAIRALQNAREYSIVEEEEDVLYRESILNRLIISDPVEFHDRTFLSHLNQLPWSEPLFTRRVEQSILTGKHMTFCRVSSDSISVASEIFKYPTFDTFVKAPSQCPYHLFMDLSNHHHSSSTAHRRMSSTKLLILALLILYRRLSHAHTL